MDNQAIDKALTEFSVEVECNMCKGIGEVGYVGYTLQNVEMEADSICPTCNGTGKITIYPFAPENKGCWHEYKYPNHFDRISLCIKCESVISTFSNLTFHSKDGWWRLIDGLREMGRLGDFIVAMLWENGCYKSRAKTIRDLSSMLNPQEAPALVAEFLGLEVE